MKIKLIKGQMNTHLIIALGILAAIMVMGIGSHVALASKFSKTSFQDGYNAGFAAEKKDRINGNEFDSKAPKGHSDAYDEGYRRGYDDGWFRGEHFSSSSAAAASSSAAAGSGDDGSHKHKDSAAASSSAVAARGGGGSVASSSSTASS